MVRNEWIKNLEGLNHVEMLWEKTTCAESFAWMLEKIVSLLLRTEMLTADIPFNCIGLIEGVFTD